MSKFKLTCILCSSLLLSVELSYAQNIHREAPMITERQEAVPNDDARQYVQTIKQNFVRAHSRVGKPKVAVFWNRSLDDQLSQWHTSSRKISTHDDWYKGKGFTANQTRLDVEGRFDDRPKASELAGFEFDSGFTRTMLGTGVNIVDRGSIMRLTHSEEKEAADKIIVADYQQIEIDALKNYADLIAEIFYAEQSESDGNPVFLVTIKSVKDGRIITKFRSRATEFSQRYEDKWIATSAGYEKVSVPVYDGSAPYLEDDIEPDSLEYLGWSVALQTMQALSKHWNNNRR